MQRRFTAVPQSPFERKIDFLSVVTSSVLFGWSSARYVFPLGLGLRAVFEKQMSEMRRRKIQYWYGMRDASIVKS